jgi:hypothetical protein
MDKATKDWEEFVAFYEIRCESPGRTEENHVKLQTENSCDSSVGIALGHRLDDRGSRVPFPAGAGNFSLHHRVHNGSGAHPASYPRGTGGSFPGGKAAGVSS